MKKHIYLILFLITAIIGVWYVMVYTDVLKNPTPSSQLIELDSVRNDSFLHLFEEDIYNLQISLTRFEDHYHQIDTKEQMYEQYLTILLTDIDDIRMRFDIVKQKIEAVYENKTAGKNIVQNIRHQIIQSIQKPELEKRLCIECVFEDTNNH